MEKARYTRRFTFLLVYAAAIGFLIGYMTGLIIGTFMGVQAMSPTYCYYESGNITMEWGGYHGYYIYFMNDTGQENGIVLSDTSPPGDGNHILVRWCWIPSIQNFRVRGAWR